MAGKWCDEGENRVAKILFVSTAVENYYMGLYNNVAEPSEAATCVALTTTAGITEPAAVGAGGYARCVLTRGSWSTTGSVAAYAQQTFTASGASWGSVTGYFITTASAGTAGVLMAVESFTDGPYTINDGDSVKVTPSISIS
ncbi:conserved hypothetical protein [Gammaproteobacteria bacterium]